MERQQEMKPDKLYIQMLGNFSMEYQGRQIQLGKWLSAKMIHLLLLLIGSRGEGVKREELLRRLYNANDSDLQASNSLRAMIFRLRRSIQESGLPEGEYISSKGGCYYWTNQPLETELDAVSFQELAKAAFGEADPLMRVELLTQTCKAYKGDFMPEMLSSDEWIRKTNWQYRELYLRALRELFDQLKKQRRYEELLEDCDLALERYPSEKWQCKKMECLIALKQYRNAMTYYETIAWESGRSCSAFLSEKLKTQYRKAKQLLQYEKADIAQIQTELGQDEKQKGPVCCEYLEFTDIYRYVMRVFGREKIETKLLLLTLLNADGAEPESSGELERSRSVADYAIRTSISDTDLYTRYGNNQFLVLLSDVERPDRADCGKSIRECYEKTIRNPRIMLKCEECAVKLEER